MITKDQMTLRDYFAGQIVSEVYASGVDEAVAAAKDAVEWRLGLALDAYGMADAMILARKYQYFDGKGWEFVGSEPTR